MFRLALNALAVMRRGAYANHDFLCGGRRYYLGDVFPVADTDDQQILSLLSAGYIAAGPPPQHHARRAAEFHRRDDEAAAAKAIAALEQNGEA